MTEQQYHDPGMQVHERWCHLQEGMGGSCTCGPVRIERPVPTTDEPKHPGVVEYERIMRGTHPSVPTREQVYEAAQEAAIYPLNHRERTILDAVLSLIQKENADG